MAEVRWLTTWDDNAQSLLAPALGLNYFALSRNQTMAQGKAFYPGTVEKDVAANNCLLSTPNRPLVWIDDEVEDYARRLKWLDDKYVKTSTFRPLTLLVNCETESQFGLSHVDIDRINDFLINLK